MNLGRKKTFFFLAETVTDRAAKLAMAVRGQGHGAVIGYLREDKNGVCLTDCFDAGHCIQSTDSLRKFIFDARDGVLYYTPIGQIEFGIVVLESGIPFTLDYKDVIEATHGFRGYATDLLRSLLEKADSLVFRDFQAHLHKRRLQYVLPRRSLFFPDFCWPSYFSSPGVNRPKYGFQSIAFLGNYPQERLRPDRESMGLLYTIRYLLRLGFMVGYFPFPHGVNDFHDYFALAASSNQRFVVHSPMHPRELHRKLRDYAWGAVVHQYRVFPERFSTCWFDDRHLHVGGASRLWEYLSAGVPLLHMNDRLNRRLVGAERAGMYFTIDNLDKIVNNGEMIYLLKREGAKLLQEKMFVDRHIDKLINFLN